MLPKLEEAIKDEILSYCYKDKEGRPYLQIYWDYRDYFDHDSADTLKKIMDADDPKQEFYDWLYELCFDNDYEYQMCKNVIERVKDFGGFDEDSPEWKELEELDWSDVQAVFWDMGGYVDYDEDHWLGQDVYINLVVDVGDANYDFTLNQPIRAYNSYGDTSISEESSLLWLVRQQGYTKSQLRKVLMSESYPEDKFLRSIVEEIENTGSHIQQLVFCVKMTLGEWFKFNGAFEQEAAGRVKYHPKQSKGRGYVVLDKNTTCGLFDPWNGGGSIFEIKLVKDVKLPLRYIYSHMGDYYQYSIRDVYCICREPWWGDTVKEIHPMKKKLEKKEDGEGRVSKVAN